jgi:hypothetical protein
VSVAALMQLVAFCRDRQVATQTERFFD